MLGSDTGNDVSPAHYPWRPAQPDLTRSAKEGARHHGYTGKRGYHPLLAVAAGTGT